MEIGPEWIIAIIAIIYLLMRKRTENARQAIEALSSRDILERQGILLSRGIPEEKRKTSNRGIQEEKHGILSRGIQEEKWNKLEKQLTKYSPKLISVGVKTMKNVYLEVQDEINKAKNEIKESVLNDLKHEMRQEMKKKINWKNS